MGQLFESRCYLCHVLHGVTTVLDCFGHFGSLSRGEGLLGSLCSCIHSSWVVRVWRGTDFSRKDIEVVENGFKYWNMCRIHLS